jgi:hypothetical protein
MQQQHFNNVVIATPLALAAAPDSSAVVLTNPEFAAALANCLHAVSERAVRSFRTHLVV